jgi:hypothetical protein
VIFDNRVQFRLLTKIASFIGKAVFCPLIAGTLMLTSIFMVGCSPPAHQAIIGTWKSDAERTIQSMHQVADLSPRIQSHFENNYYGHLIVEYRVDTVRARFDNSNYDTDYQPYKVISVSNENIITSEWNEILKIFETSTTFIDGECLYGISAEYKFREYYCPFEQK